MLGAGADQHVQGVDHGGAQRVLGVVAHGRRRGDRRDPDRRPDHHQSFGYVFGKTINNSGSRRHGTTHGFIFLVRLRSRASLMAQYTITGYDASAHMSEETRKASLGAAWGMVMSVVVSVIFGFILLVAVTFAIPSAGAVANAAFIVRTSGRLDGQQLGGVPALHRRASRSSSARSRRSTSASRMMFAFSRDGAVPGAAALAEGLQARPGARQHGVGDLRAGVPDAAARRSGGVVGYAAATVVAVIGLYIAFVIPIILRLRAGESFEARPGPRQALQVDRLDRDHLDRPHLHHLHAPDAYQGGIPFKSSFTLGLASTTRRSRSAARSCSSAAGTSCRARKWFKGPVRQGTDEELAQIEAGFGHRRLRRPRPQARRSTRVDTAGGLQCPPAVSLQTAASSLVLRGFPLVLPHRRDDQHGRLRRVAERAGDAAHERGLETAAPMSRDDDQISVDVAPPPGR